MNAISKVVMMTTMTVKLLMQFTVKDAKGGKRKKIIFKRTIEYLV